MMRHIPDLAYGQVFCWMDPQTGLKMEGMAGVRETFAENAEPFWQLHFVKPVSCSGVAGKVE